MVKRTNWWFVEKWKCGKVGHITVQFPFPLGLGKYPNLQDEFESRVQKKLEMIRGLRGREDVSDHSIWSQIPVSPTWTVKDSTGLGWIPDAAVEDSGLDEGTLWALGTWHGPGCLCLQCNCKQVPTRCWSGKQWLQRPAWEVVSSR